MKLLNTAPITDTSQFPVKKGTLQFLQDAHRETTAAVVQALIGPGYDPLVIYVLSGVTNGATAPTYNINPGFIFYAGEVFQFDATSFTATSGNVGVFSIVQTQYTTDADPVTFTDLSVRNIHNIRKMQLAQGAPGSGLANYAQAYFLSFYIPQQLNFTAPTSGSYVGNQLQLIGTYPNIIGFVTPAGNRNPIVYAGSFNVGNVPAASTDYSVTFADVGTADYYIQGTMISNGTHSQDTNCIWTVSNRTATGFTLTINEVTASGQNLAFEFILFQK